MHIAFKITPVDVAFRLVRTALIGLGFKRLSPPDRVRIGGQVHPLSAELHEQVVFQLRRSPAYFPDAAGAADEIEADTVLADAYYALAQLLGRFHRAALDSYFVYNTRATQRCRQVLRRVEVGAKHPELAPHLDHARRLVVMGGPLRLLLTPFRRPRPKKAPAPRKTALREERAELLGDLMKQVQATPVA